MGISYFLLNSKALIAISIVAVRIFLEYSSDNADSMRCFAGSSLTIKDSRFPTVPGSYARRVVILFGRTRISCPVELERSNEPPRRSGAATGIVSSMIS
jgi:hypothetical protein